MPPSPNPEPLGSSSSPRPSSPPLRFDSPEAPSAEAAARWTGLGSNRPSSSKSSPPPSSPPFTGTPIGGYYPSSRNNPSSPPRGLYAGGWMEKLLLLTCLTSLLTNLLTLIILVGLIVFAVAAIRG